MGTVTRLITFSEEVHLFLEKQFIMKLSILVILLSATALQGLPHEDRRDTNLHKDEKAFQLIQMQSRLNGVILPPMEERTNPENEALLASIFERNDPLPESYDARDEGLVTSIKNQGQCGSCAAFSSMSNIETCMLKSGAKLEDVDLAEQYLIDFGYNGGDMAGCNGAWPHAYLKWFSGEAPGEGRSPHEVQQEYLEAYPTLTCPPDLQYWNSGAIATSSVHEYTCSEEKLMKLIYNYGSASITVSAGDPAFQRYTSGIMDSCRSTTQTHAISAIGWGVEDGVKYWIVKNSWGEYWGEKGFGKIRRGTNECGIENYCGTIVCESSGTPEPVPQQ